ncbi:MAG: N-methyl-L-tryptophan oxidase [Rummeliibacillus sp.]|uniref:N-methyl-L-tryptophan oxidase n=1 Tax=Rummeliibacillus sp. POC4 TaxID=2305899 RepID=UPI000E66FB37|nr:N-methyl-L-tryptophan oxidase [Rummeliibacillus sp. POC4]RIJ64053.1 N-methyl-L-tryptophan oxidase [Rummeliibacillus sp. POC4]
MGKYDVIVIGAGSMGMAAGYFLSKSGKKTLLLDAFNPPHDHGSHHGETRIIRYAYGEGHEYVPFALRARDLWKELAQNVHKELLLETGVINVGEKDDPFIKNVISSAEKFNLPLEVLSADKVHKKWSGLKIPEDFVGCFEPTSGVLKVEECVSAFREMAMREGAEIRTNSKVTKVDAKENEVTITIADGTRFTANAAIFSVGAWARELLKQLDLELPLNPIRKTFAWYDVEEDLYSSNNFPAFAFKLPDSCYYGFPSIDGTGLKVGRHDTGESIDPNKDKLPFGEVSGEKEDLENILDKFMPQQQHTLKHGKTCMYTMTPDEDFIIDLHPKYKNIAIAAGFSGHGFKFASAVGETLSNLILKGKTDLDIKPFSLQRFL